MNDAARDSLGEFQSSIFDASDGHQLVDFIRKKKGLRAQPQKIFDDVPSDRQSLHIEIQRLEADDTLQPDKSAPENATPTKAPGENEVIAARNKSPDRPASPKRSLAKSPAYLESRVKLKRLTHSIGRRTLLKEFEKTLQESRFLPETCSTPLTANVPNKSTAIRTEKEQLLSQAISVDAANQVIVCTPITVTDDDSPHHHQQPLEPSPQSDNKITSPCNTENMLDLQMQNDMLLEMLNENEAEPDIVSNLNINRTSTPKKGESRRTFTVHRATKSSERLILSPLRSQGECVRLPLSPRSPENNTLTNKRIFATPKQKKILLSRFGRNTPQSPPPVEQNTQKTSRIPVIIRSTNTQPVPVSSPHEVQTAQIIEQIQKSQPSNAPVIVIPVNQTFNQLPQEAPRPGSKDRTAAQSPCSNEITSTTTTSIPNRVVSPVASQSHKQNLSFTSLRVQDILTEDESNSSDDNRPQRTLQNFPNPSNSTKRIQGRKQQKNKLSLRQSQMENSNRHLREVIKPGELAHMKSFEILDLRKRNSRGELHKNLNLTNRESSMLEKQIELELLRRSIQERNYEDEVFEMEVLPTPPVEFCDRRISARPQEKEKTLRISEESNDRRLTARQLEIRNSWKKTEEHDFKRISATRPQEEEHNSKRSVESDGVPSSARSEEEQKPLEGRQSDDLETSTDDRISMSQEPSQRNSKSSVGHKTRKKKKMPEEVKRYLQTSEMVTKIKYLNLSKRKLYNKGNSDANSSDDRSPCSTPLRHKKSSLSNSRQLRSEGPMLPPPSPTYSLPSQNYAPAPAQSPPQAMPFSPIPQTSDREENNVVFKKPVGKPKKKVTTQQQSKRERVKKRPQPPPVDPEEENSTVDESATVRRSKRDRRPPTAYWACSKKEYSVPYAVENILMDVRHLQKKRHTKKNLPKHNEDLVANTKNKKHNSVNKNQNNKKSHNNSQQQESDTSERVKKKAKKTSHQPEIDSKVIHITADDADTECLQFPSASSTLVNKNQKKKKSHNNSQQQDSDTSERVKKKAKKISHQPDINSEIIHITADDAGAECLQFPSASSTLVRAESSTTTSHQYESHDTNRPSKSKSKKRRNQSSCTSAEPVGCQIINTNVAQSSTTTASIPSEVEISAFQQVRLATIAEDSVPEVNPHVVISARSEMSRCSTELMPPPISVVIKKAKNRSFRREHDESIADVSSAHVNKLFDQLKHSSVCQPPGDTTGTSSSTATVNCNGLVTPLSRDQNRNDAYKGTIKNFKIKVMRLKSRTLSADYNEKVCDSGFSSEDMSSAPKKKGDILLDWLKQILMHSKSPTNPNKGVARFLQADGFHLANPEDLIFQEIDGVEYAFYDTKQQFSIGYIRFNPHTSKKKCTAKKFELNFVLLSGRLKFFVNGNTVESKNGDLITVFVGTAYGISNSSNDPALVMVIKK